MFVSQCKQLFSLLLLVVMAASLQAAVDDIGAKRTRNALVLYSYDDNLPWQRQLREGMYSRIQDLSGHENIEIYEERLDGYRLGRGSRQRIWVDFLKAKYAGLELDLVITEGELAAELLDKNQHLFADAPHFIVLADAAYAAANSFIPNAEAEAVLFRNLVNIVSLRPDTRKLVLIGNLLPDTNDAIRRHWLEHYSNTLELEVWQDDFTFTELYQRASELPQDAVILYELVGFDRTGAQAVPYDVAEQLSAAASVPVFVSHSALVGSGVVGGFLVSAQLTGEMMAEVIAGVARENVRAMDLYRSEYDSRALKRWQIPADSLPPESIIRFREFNRQRWYFVLALLALTAIVGWLLLVLNMRVRYRLEREVGLRRKAEERAVHNANHDALTGLPSLRLCKDRLARAISSARRAQHRVAVIFVDLNDFKAVNDTYGHDAGDDLLRIMAQRFRMTLREVDTIARIGGDEFLIILPDIRERKDAEKVCRKLGAVADQPVLLNDHVAIIVTASLGFACFPDDGDKEQQLIKVADDSMYVAKRMRKRVAKSRELAADV